nr:MAG TPA: hypothetical protein [Bacteriophage sp.]
MVGASYHLALLVRWLARKYRCIGKHELGCGQATIF